MTKARLREDFPVLPDAVLEPTTAPELLDEITQRYRQLQGLPVQEQPCHSHHRGRTLHGSPAYLALELEIRALSGRYWRLTSGIAITDAQKSTVVTRDGGGMKSLRD